MKKTLLLAGAALTLITSNANAMYLEMNPYIGLDYAISEFSMSGNADNLIEDDYKIHTLVGGMKFEKYLGVEAYIERSERESYKHPNSKFTSNHYSLGADLLGYYPMFRDLDIIGGFGWGLYNFSVRQAGQGKDHDEGYGLRYTLGTQYNFSQNWGVRLSYRYVDFSDTGYMNHMNEYSLGIRYTF